MSIKGIREYETGFMFQALNAEASLKLRAYVNELKKNGIRLENVIEWFFREYLLNEFLVEQYVINMPSEACSYLEKCKIIATEIDGVLRQYQMYVGKGQIDRELLETSSYPLPFKEVKSAVTNKYVYTKSDIIKQELFLLFSDQSMLGYVPKLGNDLQSFFDLILNQKLNISDYESVNSNNKLRWLEKRGTIIIDETGDIKLATEKVILLKDLYDHDVSCISYWPKRDMIEELVNSGDLEFGSTLLSIPEQKYFNYLLNKKDYSNGPELRNKYIHGSYPNDEMQQINDYYEFLKIMIILIIKINEDLCLMQSQDENKVE